MGHNACIRSGPAVLATPRARPESKGIPTMKKVSQQTVARLRTRVDRAKARQQAALERATQATMALRDAEEATWAAQTALREAEVALGAPRVELHFTPDRDPATFDLGDEIPCDCDRTGIGGTHEDHCATVVS